MEPATPLFLVLLSIVLVFAAVQGRAAQERASKESGGTQKPLSDASVIITGVIAGILLLVGLGTMLVRRFSTTGEAARLDTWTRVLQHALGPTVAGVAGDLLGHKTWLALLIVGIIGTVFAVGSGPPSSPLSWIAYAALGALFLVTFFMSPTVQGAAGERVLGRMAQNLREFVTSKVVVGTLVFLVGALVLLALGTLYPLIGWAVLATVIALALYYWHRATFRAPTPAAERGDADATAAEDGDEVVEAVGEATTSAWTDFKNWFADIVAVITLSPDELKAYRERTGAAKENLEADVADARAVRDAQIEARKAMWARYGLVLATLGTSGGIVALAVLLPYLWRRLPPLRLGGNMGKELLGDPVPLSTYAAMEVPESADVWRAPSLRGLPKKALMGGAGTSNYTLAWWQFINSRNHDKAIPMLELGPAGQVLLGPGPTAATVALSSPAPQGLVYKVPIDVVPQKWQHVVLRASGDRTDIFLDGKLVGSSLHPPGPIRAGDVFTLPGTATRQTEGGIAKVTYSNKAEPFSAIFLAAHSPPG